MSFIFGIRDFLKLHRWKLDKRQNNSNEPVKLKNLDKHELANKMEIFNGRNR